MNYDYLDKLASKLANNDESVLDVLSTGERIYVCIAANQAQHLTDKLAFSINRLGAEALEELIIRHQYD